MSEKEVGQSGVSSQPIGKQIQTVFAHLVVTHVNLLYIQVGVQRLGDWFYLVVVQLVFEKVQIL